MKLPQAALVRGAHAPSRVLAGALAGQRVARGPRVKIHRGERRTTGFGEGAEACTRGRVRSPARFYSDFNGMIAVEGNEAAIADLHDICTGRILHVWHGGSG